MDLIQTDQNQVPVEAEPRYVPATASLPIQKTEHGQTWVRLVATIFGAILLIVIIVLLARWIYHTAHHANTTVPAVSQPATESASPNTQAGIQPQTSGGTPAVSAPPANTPAKTSITNTGPGNVVAIFAASSVAAAGLHYIISIRRFSRG